MCIVVGNTKFQPGILPLIKFKPRWNRHGNRLRNVHSRGDFIVLAGVRVRVLVAEEKYGAIERAVRRRNVRATGMRIGVQA